MNLKEEIQRKVVEIESMDDHNDLGAIDYRWGFVNGLEYVLHLLEKQENTVDDSFELLRKS